jgi:hypothetical protein
MKVIVCQEYDNSNPKGNGLFGLLLNFFGFRIRNDKLLPAKHSPLMPYSRLLTYKKLNFGLHQFGFQE